jgi:hypothetical protein
MRVGPEHPVTVTQDGVTRSYILDDWQRTETRGGGWPTISLTLREVPNATANPHHEGEGECRPIEPGAGYRWLLVSELDNAPAGTEYYDSGGEWTANGEWPNIRSTNFWYRVPLATDYWIPSSPSPATCPPLPDGYRLPLLSEPDVVTRKMMWWSCSSEAWERSDRSTLGASYRHYSTIWHCVPILPCEMTAPAPELPARRTRRKLEF